MFFQIDDWSNYFVSECGQIINSSDKILTINKHNRINFYRVVDNKTECKSFLVNYIVAKMFIPNPDKFKFVNHKNNDQHNNHKNNLEWAKFKKVPLNKSFANHEKSKYWSIKNEKKPDQVYNNTAVKYLFDCYCGHTFKQSPSEIQRFWCGYCSTPPQYLCTDEKCQSCFNKSFASHEKSKYWSIKNKESPRAVFKSSTKYYIIDCDCGHSSSKQIGSMQFSECGYCSSFPKHLCNDENCQSCFDKSFASHEKAKYWSLKNDKSAREVFKSSCFKYIFNCCKCGHEYRATAGDVSIRDRWCNCTKNKTEAKLFDFLSDNYGENVKKQLKVNWCKNIKFLPFDFCIEDYKIIIELDGPQHFKQISNWTSPEKTQLNDKYKMDCANKNGYSMIRISQEDVLADKNNWQDRLQLAIKLNDTFINTFIGKCYEK